MKLNRFMNTYLLLKNVNRYRRKNQSSPGDKNEKCENYYRVDDAEDDGRGTY
ncbi:MAG: hypothetical protein ACM3TR_01210 [Caulobacteraceae bacterium]